MEHEKREMKNMKAKSPSNRPLLTPPCPSRPKNRTFTKENSSFFTEGTFRRFFTVLASARTTQKKKQERRLTGGVRPKKVQGLFFFWPQLLHDFWSHFKKIMFLSRLGRGDSLGGLFLFPFCFFDLRFFSLFFRFLFLLAFLFVSLQGS